jgi:hypothetical protein
MLLVTYPSQHHHQQNKLEHEPQGLSGNDTTDRAMILRYNCRSFWGFLRPEVLEAQNYSQILTPNRVKTGSPPEKAATAFFNWKRIEASGRKTEESKLATLSLQISWR